MVLNVLVLGVSVVPGASPVLEAGLEGGQGGGEEEVLEVEG